MRVLLLYPEFPETFWGFKHALKFVRKPVSLPPLGLLTVAAMLPRDWPVRLVDENAEELRDEDLARAECVFLSAMQLQERSTRRAIARCRDAGVPVVAGGPLFSSSPDLAESVDHLVLGEAEVVLPELLDDLSRGRARRVYRADRFADLRVTPVPRWELIDRRRYATMSVQVTRGCPNDCDFCNVTTLFGRRVRTKTPAQVIAELEALDDTGWRSGVFFVDDNFIGNRAFLKNALLPAMIRWRDGRRGVSFSTQASINLADDDVLMEMMAAAGFDTVFIGIETPEEAGLRECRKTTNRDRDMVADVRRIQRAGLQVQGGFIVGFDSDSPNVFERQIAFIQKSGIVTAMVGLLNAMPGTRLFERLEAAGRLLGEPSGDNVDGTTNIVPSMGIEALMDGYRSILGHIYAPRHYYARVRTFLREFRPAGLARRVRSGDIGALLRSITRLGILGRERFQYWRLLLWTLVHHRQSLGLAVTLAVYGHHFRRICRPRRPKKDAGALAEVGP